uniref:Uncharacterized protein n=1 Tax=Hyaloperonospora arabidopsidis (strain Emoy2) TaxID=559515 RepID=M4BDF9_HYAAE
MHTESPRRTHCWRVSGMSTTDAIWKSYCSARRRLLMTRTATNDAGEASMRTTDMIKTEFLNSEL